MAKRTRVIDKGYKKAISDLKKMYKGKQVVAGIYGENASKQVEGTDFDMVSLATVHEYGSENGHIPERSHLRSTADVLVQKRLPEALQNAVAAVIDKRLTPQQALDQIALLFKSTIQTRIKTRQIKQDLKGKRAGQTALIDTGRYVNSIDAEVREK